MAAMKYILCVFWLGGLHLPHFMTCAADLFIGSPEKKQVPLPLDGEATSWWVAQLGAGPSRATWSLLACLAVPATHLRGWRRLAT